MLFTIPINTELCHVSAHIADDKAYPKDRIKALTWGFGSCHE